MPLSEKTLAKAKYKCYNAGNLRVYFTKERGSPLSFALKEGGNMKVTELVESFAKPIV